MVSLTLRFTKVDCNQIDMTVPQNPGFFYVVNFGLSQNEVDRQFAIGKEVFQLPTEEKLKYRAELEKGGYNGYKPLGIRVSIETLIGISCSDLSNSHRVGGPPRDL